MRVHGAVLLAGALALAQARASDVVKLSASNFNRKVLHDDGVWMVEFFAPWCGHCKALAPEWEKAATALKGVVNVAAVDATVESSLAAQHGVQGYPTIKIFGADKTKPIDYRGAREAKAIASEGLKVAKQVVKDRLAGRSKPSSGGARSSSSSSGGGDGGGNAVVELTDADFDSKVLQSEDLWLVEFYAPWCGHCKNLAPHWKSAARKLKGKVKLGAVDATSQQALASRFGIRGFPTIKLFRPGKGKSDAAAEDYQGGRTTGDIVDYALAKLDELGPPPKVEQLVSQAQLDEACAGKTICVVAFVPHILDSGKDGRSGYIETLQAVAKLRRRDPFAFLWVEAGAQSAIETGLDLTFGFPAVIAVARSKGRASIHRGAFTEKGVSSFLTGLMTGRVTSEPFDMPSIAKTEPWNGKDAAPPEEEFDLSEIMAEEL